MGPSPQKPRFKEIVEEQGFAIEFLSDFAKACTSGLPVQVGYSGVMCATGVAIRRAGARV